MRLKKSVNTRFVSETAKNSKTNSPAKPQVKNILITQQKPESDKNPYTELARKHNLAIEFKSFIQLEPVSSKEFRRQRIAPAEYNALIFTSRNAVDQFFVLCDGLRTKMSSETKYYCMTEAIALYLQKYILYRKRKVFFGDGTMQGLFEVISKHRDNERYLLLVSDNYKGEISEFMRRQQYQFAEAVIFKTVPVQLKEKEIRKYDMIVFFSAAGVHALKSNIPNFRQRQIYFGAFGPFTSQAVLESGYRLHINAPAPATPSMAMAIDLFLGNGESIK